MTSVTVTNTTLFHVAANYLLDATQWGRIAALNGLSDPMLVGTVSLLIPPPGTSVNLTALAQS